MRIHPFILLITMLVVGVRCHIQASFSLRNSKTNSSGGSYATISGPSLDVCAISCAKEGYNCLSAVWSEEKRCELYGFYNIHPVSAPRKTLIQRGELQFSFLSQLHNCAMQYITQHNIFLDIYAKELGPLRALSRVFTGRTNILLSVPVQKKGILVAVKYFSVGKGDFYIGGWRRNFTNQNQIYRAWEVRITCQKTGSNDQVNLYATCYGLFYESFIYKSKKSQIFVVDVFFIYSSIKLYGAECLC